MHYREVCRVLGRYLFFFSFILLVPLIIALYYEYVEKLPFPPSSSSFVWTLFICLGISAIFLLIGRHSTGRFYRRESIFLVVMIWLISGLIGALPFYLSGTLTHPIDAYFESISGFTTTGATVIAPKAYDDKGKEIPIHVSNIHVPGKTYSYYGTIAPVRHPATGKILYSGVEAVSRGILFWRSFIQWLGGMGIVVLFLAILPALSIGGKFLYEMEVPGPTKDTLAPRIKDTASILWKLYVGLTLLEITLLIWTNPNISLLDAFCVTFSTLSTGGFAIKNASIAGYGSALTDWIVIIFMFLGAINFSLYFHMMRKKLHHICEPDFLLYLAIVVIGSAAVSSYLVGSNFLNLDGSKGVYTLSQAIRNGTFQAISAQTSTGFVTTNYDIWPFPSQMFMLLLMYVGGMAGSTAGGIKTSRFLILYKVVLHKIEAIFRPDVVKKTRLANKEISPNVSMTVLAFFSIVIFIAVLGMVLLVLFGIDPETSIGAIACMVNNIGIAFRSAGPSSSFAFFSIGAKLVSIIWMLLGRLEFFAVLLLLLPSFWKK